MNEDRRSVSALLCTPVLVFALAVLLPPPGRAEPWIPPGDTLLRHDLQMLYDAGLLTGPSLSWPISWPDVARDLGRADALQLRPGAEAALARLRVRLAREQRTGDVSAAARVGLAEEPSELRTFEDTPREDGEVAVSADWIGERFAWKAAATVVTDPDDDQAVRPDGSYVAVSLGNWMLSAGYLDRWWGPGWEGSLVLSSNARPMPAIAVDRNQATPFDLPVLRWLGPWRFSTLMAQFESDRDYSDALLFGMRAEIRPIPSLQLAASRTAQWCGEGRPCDLDTFWDLLIGNDNDQDLDEQPGNQLAGFDVRWSWPGARVPLALYAQGIGEDEAGFLPSKYLGLFGAELWGNVRGGSWRAHVEYADTACDFVNSEPEFGCAYTNVIYTSGYRYRGRVLGHPIDADGEALSAGALIVDANGHRWDILVRNVKLNRAGAAEGHSLAADAARVMDVALVHQRVHRWGTITLSLGFSDVESTGALVVEDGLRGSVAWRHEWP